MTAAQYEAVAARYVERHGEPLVADASWVGPLFNTCRAAVECDPGIDQIGFSDEGIEAEAVERTADVIYVITYGLHGLRELA